MAIESYVDLLNEAASSETAIFHEFRILYSQGDGAVHAFFEGEEDPLYFLPAIRAANPERHVHSYVCYGKRKVWSIRTSIYENGFERTSCLFFVDRDFDDLLGGQIGQDDRTYITDNYSIENDIATVHGVEVLLVDFGGMSRADPDFAGTLTAYTNASKLFVEAMRPFSAWSLAMRSNGKRPNLNNINIGRIIDVTANSVKRRPKSFAEFRRLAGMENEHLPCAPVKRWIRELSKKPHKCWIRGKFELWFFRQFLKDWLHCLASSKPKCRWKMPPPLTQSTLFEALGARLPRPKSLHTFLIATAR